MPYSYAVYTGNGATTQYTVPFPYIRREHVVASINRVATTAFTWVNNSTIQFNTAPANAARVEVRRVTPVNLPLVDFSDGSTLVAADLDTNALQQTYINQEQDDQIQDGIRINAQGELDAGGQIITDVGTPLVATDAATKGYVDTNDALKVAKAGDTMSGPLAMGGNKVTGLGAPTSASDAATKAYADAIVTSGVPDGDKGDIIVGGNGTAWTIDSGVITSDKIANGAVTSSKLAAGVIVDSISSTSTTTAAAPNSVKTAYDLANAALPKAGGTLSGNVDNTATGYFDLPVGSTAQRPGSPNSGMVRFNTDIGQYEGHNGTTWASIGGGATGGGADRVFMENDQTITTNYTITAGRNAVTAGPVTINAGVTVTVPSGSAWVVV